MQGVIWDAASGCNLIFPCLFFFILQNKCVPYWPSPDESKEYKNYVVKYVSERDADDYKVRVMEVVPRDGVSPHHVTTHHIW